MDHHAQIMTLLIRRTKMLAGRRFDSEEKTTGAQLQSALLCQDRIKWLIVHRMLEVDVT